MIESFIQHFQNIIFHLSYNSFATYFFLLCLQKLSWNRYKPKITFSYDFTNNVQQMFCDNFKLISHLELKSGTNVWGKFWLIKKLSKPLLWKIEIRSYDHDCFLFRNISSNFCWYILWCYYTIFWALFINQ